MEVEIGRGKKGRRAYGFDDIAIVPSAARATPTTSTSPGRSGPTASSSRCSPPRWTASSRPRPRAIIGKLGGLAVLNLEGIFTRYEDAEEQLERIAQLPKEQATAEMQRIYQEPVKPELIARAHPGDQGAGRRRRPASLTPQRVRELLRAARSRPGSTSS